MILVMKATHLAPLIFLLLLVFHSADAIGQSALSGLNEISVEVNVGQGRTESNQLARVLQNSSVLPATIRDKVELEIRRSTSLRIVPGAPVKLYVLARVTQQNDTLDRAAGYICEVRLFVEEPVRIERNGVLEPATTWHSTEWVSWGPDDQVVLELSSKIDRPLTQFLNEYLAANPGR